MTSSYLSPAQAAGQQANWTADQWAAYWVGQAEEGARWHGINHGSGYLPPCTPSRLMYLLDVHGRTAADLAFRDMLAAAYRDAYDHAKTAAQQAS